MTMIDLDSQIKAAINKLIARITENETEPTYDFLLEMNEIGNDLLTLAQQGDNYKDLILSLIKEEWIDTFMVIKVLKNMLTENKK